MLSTSRHIISTPGWGTRVIVAREQVWTGLSKRWFSPSTARKTGINRNNSDTEGKHEGVKSRDSVESMEVGAINYKGQEYFPEESGI